jgi:hypothetical protein
MQISARSKYLITGRVEYKRDRPISISFQLHDVMDGTVAWARRFENTDIAHDRTAFEKEIVRKVATTLAQPHGVIHARELAKNASGDGDLRYRCLIRSIEFWRTDDPVVQERVRVCLEHATTVDPNFAGGFAALSLVAMREYYDGRDGDRTKLDWALKTALRAVELKPESARARQTLMVVLFARGEIAAALAEGEKAMSLNPHDMTVLTAYGMRLAASGDLVKGAALLNRAAVESPVRLPALNFALFLCAYLLGNNESASYHVGLLTSETSPYALFARALDAWRVGDRERARKIIDKLVALQPAWASAPRRRLERFIPSSAIVDRLVHDLAEAGLSDGR